MIYEYPESHAAIRQGDIFSNLPLLDISLAQLFVVGEKEGSAEARRWEDVITDEFTREEFVRLVVTARPALGIVITQDCDTQFGDSITLSSIRPIADVVSGFKSNPPKTSQEQIRSWGKKNLKWFYLPPDMKMNFGGRMAVNFQVTFSVPRVDLESLRQFRRGRLNPEADEHFRERLSEFYRRYPVDEWYPLNREEFEAYRIGAPDALPRPWQTITDNSGNT